MARIKNLAKDTLVYGLAVVLNPLVNTFFLLKLLTSRLDQYQYGVYTYFYALAGILIVVYSMRMETTYFRMNNDHDEDTVFSNTFNLVIAGSTILSLLLWVISGPLADMIGDPNYARFFKYFAIILWFDAFCAVPFARLRHQEKSLKFSLLKIFNVLLTFFLILALFFVVPKTSLMKFEIIQNWVSTEYWLDGIFVCNLIASAVLFLYFSRHIVQLRLKNMDYSLVRKILIYASPLILISLAGNANQFLDRILIPFISGSSIQEGMSNAGIYGGAVKIATIMLLFSKAFNYAFDPYVFKSYKQEKNTKHLSQIALIYTVISSAILVFSVCFSDLLSLLLGSDFKIGMQYVPMLLVSYLLVGLYYHFSVWYKLTDQTMIGAKITVLGVIITFLFNLFLVPKFGLYGPAITIIVNYLFMSTLCLLWARKYLVIYYPLGRMVFHILWSLVFIMIYNYLILQSSYSLLFSGLLFIVYLGSILLIEKELVKKLNLVQFFTK